MTSKSKWEVGQAVTVYFSHANQGTARFQNTTITKVGRKYISVAGLPGSKFDAEYEPPMEDHSLLYTPTGYVEMMYAKDVRHALDSSKYGRDYPMSLLLQIGDYFGIKRPEHLREDIDPKALKSIKDTKPKT